MFFLQILNMGYMASFVILAVLLIRGVLLRRFPKKYAYGLWLIVAIRLICPVMLSSPMSLFNVELLSKPAPAVFSQTGIIWDVSSVGDSSVHITGQIETDAQSAEKGNLSLSSQNEAGANAAGFPDGMAVGATGERKTGESMLMFTALRIAAYVWVAGVILLLLWNVVQTVFLKRRLRKAVLYSENVYECEGIASPFVMGVLRPHIYIPFRLEQREREYILRHERCHIRRRDYLVKLLAFMITLVYWFHPLVWISYFCMVRDMEMSCDEYVLTKMGREIRQDYSMSLLCFAMNRRRFSMNLLAFGETNTRKRVKNIMNYKKQAKWTGLVAIVLIILAGVICLTNGKKEQPKKEGVAEQETVLTETTIDGYQLRLVAKKADIVKDENSPYHDMYEGTFLLRTYENNKKLSELEVAFDRTEGTIHFPKQLSLALEDYDGDKQKNDFALGQKLGDSAMTYQFYTMNKYGYIEQIQLAVDDDGRKNSIVAETGDYSPVFKRENGVIQYSVYDEESGKITKQGAHVMQGGQMSDMSPGEE